MKEKFFTFFFLLGTFLFFGSNISFSGDKDKEYIGAETCRAVMRHNMQLMNHQSIAKNW